MTSSYASENIPLSACQKAHRSIVASHPLKSSDERASKILQNNVLVEALWRLVSRTLRLGARTQDSATLDAIAWTERTIINRMPVAAC